METNNSQKHVVIIKLLCSGLGKKKKTKQNISLLETSTKFCMMVTWTLLKYEISSAIQVLIIFKMAGSYFKMTSFLKIFLFRFLCKNSTPTVSRSYYWVLWFEGIWIYTSWECLYPCYSFPGQMVFKDCKGFVLYILMWIQPPL